MHGQTNIKFVQQLSTAEENGYQESGKYCMTE